MTGPPPVAGPPVGLRRAAGPRALAAAFSAVLLAGCLCVHPPDAERWLDIGFRTPEQTFDTFRTAVAGDVASLEYRCLSAGFRRANGLSQHVYREAREELLSEKPWIRLVANARIVSSRRTSERTHELEVVVDAGVKHERLGVRLVRDDYIELWGPGPSGRAVLLWDDYADFAQLVRLQPLPGGAFDLSLHRRVEPWDHEDLSGATELRAGQAWKIDELWPLDGESQGSPAP